MTLVWRHCNEDTHKTKMDLISLRWHRNGRDSVSNHQPHDCLLSRLFRRRSKKTSKLRVTGLCSGSSPGTGEFPAQMASYAENVSIWWRHHDRWREVDGHIAKCKHQSFIRNTPSWLLCIVMVWDNGLHRLSYNLFVKPTTIWRVSTT